MERRAPGVHGVYELAQPCEAVAEHAGCSPLDYVQRLRVALARELVKNSELAMERVAERTGFSSAHQLRRVWRAAEVTPPTAQRARMSG